MNQFRIWHCEFIIENKRLLTDLNPIQTFLLNNVQAPALRDSYRHHIQRRSSNANNICECRALLLVEESPPGSPSMTMSPPGKSGLYEPGSVRLVTDRLNSRHRANTDIK